jgi:hypothetical protein
VSDESHVAPSAMSPPPPGRAESARWSRTHYLPTHTPPRPRVLLFMELSALMHTVNSAWR